ncbi:Glycosyltransferase 25 family member [Gryllus bimaculatus]|nr:Glycosyltransferase 25 family member [Gryllus bimaculatus]
MTRLSRDLLWLNSCGWFSPAAGIHRLSESKYLKKEFLLLTVATNQTDGYQRFIRSVGIYDIPAQVLGMNQKWLGGDMNYPGGGFKINLLKKELLKYKDDPQKIIMFTDSYDVILLAPVEKILERFDNLEARIVFSAEGLCWPDQSLESLYPRVQKGKRFLNSGGFIGYASQLYDIITSAEIKNTDDDQLFFTKIYLNEELREKFNIKLDHRSTIFQNLNGATNLWLIADWTVSQHGVSKPAGISPREVMEELTCDVELRFKGREAYLQNTVYNTNPLVVHGNGHSKLVLNSLGNYLANSWNPEDGCLSCWDNSIGLEDKPKTAYPKVLIAIFIEQPTPFLEEFFQKVLNLEYPKNKLHLFIHNNVKFHEEIVNQFILKHADSYKSVKRIEQKDEIKEKQARSLAIDYFQTKKCDYFLNIDSEAHLDNPNSLALLIVQNSHINLYALEDKSDFKFYFMPARSIVAPLLLRPYKAWSNFWGALTPDGYYARSSDYMDIIHNERRYESFLNNLE